MLPVPQGTEFLVIFIQNLLKNLETRFSCTFNDILDIHENAFLSLLAVIRNDKFCIRFQKCVDLEENCLEETYRLESLNYILFNFFHHLVFSFNLIRTKIRFSTNLET